MKRYYIYILAISIISFSCSKDRIDPTPKLNKYEPLEPYFKTKRIAPQTFKITESNEAEIEGSQGTKVYIPRGILIFPNGQDVDYPYTIELIELYTPKEMIYYQKGTTSEGYLIETEGEVYIRASKEDGYGKMQELTLKPGETYSLFMPSDSARNTLKVLYDISKKNGMANWTSEKDDAGANSEADLYFSKEANGHVANVGKLGWINCGLKHEGYYKLKFTSTVDDLTNVGIFGYVEKYKSVAQAHQKSFSAMPDSTDIKIIAIAIDSNKKLYKQSFSTVITKSGSIPIKLKKSSSLNITYELNSLSN